MRLLRLFALTLSLLVSGTALAQETYLLQALNGKELVEDPNVPTKPRELPPIDQIWRPGLHIDVGMGLHGGVYLVEGSSRDYSIGSSIKTDVGYYLNEDWALEASSFIRFSRVNNFVVWGTQLSIGARQRLPSGWMDEQVPYARYFFGSNINVIYLNNQQLPEFDQPYSRIQFEGPMVGVAIGGMRLSEKKNVWFWEAAVTGEWLVRESGIQMDADVPIIVARSSLNGQSQLYTIYLTFGGFIW
ncbi:hypothetical protein [Bdellovibrio sp. HCB209]|uniref:hypothetical protein n=1 Tax=Bdellovibrio sp. HCB209 TaxID=3394354 RepID=UPI0039B4398F